MKTKKIIFIRHGEYVNIEPFNLSDKGKIVVRGLAVQLIHEIKDKDVVFLTSMANRAIQTSEVLEEIWSGRGIDVAFQKQYELWSGSNAYSEAKRLRKEGKEVSVYNEDWLKKFIISCNNEVVVMVSHLEIVELFPILFGFSNKEITKGQARVLNLNSKKEIIV